MESIIDKILAIDRHAQEELEQAKQDVQLTVQKAEKESLLIKREIAEDTKKRIAQIEEQHKEECRRRTAELSEHYKKKTEDMLKRYENTHTEIEDIIFAEITGVRK